MPTLKSGKQQANLLPGAEPDTDCQDPASESVDPSTGSGSPENLETDHLEEDHDHEVSWQEIASQQPETTNTIANWIPRRAGWTIFLERIALAIERPANRMIGTAQLNPFYHTGTIATLLLVIVALTGFFLFLFFQYGFDASYNAVLTRIETPFIARTIRAIHRYASGALIITSLLHAYRTLFMERFRGPRWLAWVTGIIITILLWFAGVTGYWLVWDARAQLINDAFVDFLQTTTPFADSFMVALIKGSTTGESWQFFLAILAVHVLLTSIVAGFYWFHIKRLNRPRWLPPAFWVVGVAVVVLLVSLFFPAGMLPQGDFSKMPGPLKIDPIFLFFLPVREYTTANWLLWGGLAVFIVAFAALPWIPRGRRKRLEDSAESESNVEPLVNVIKERCSGCTVCALDCPYGAIKMVDRTDGKRHKYIAIEDPGLCVSCGICVGSCDGVAVTLGNTPPSALWDTVAAQLTLARLRRPIEDVKVVFTCERHSVHGARPYLEYTAESQDDQSVEVITLPCVGATPPDLLSRTLEEGVANVHVIGCPVDDCANREGNIWLEQRITRERVPRLKRPYATAPITASWLPPDDFRLGVESIPKTPDSEEGDQETVDYMALRQMAQTLTWRNYGIGFLLLALVMVAQILMTDLPFTPYKDTSAVGRVLIADIAAPIGRTSFISSTLGSTLDLRLEADGQVIFEDSLETSDVLAPDSYPYFEELDLRPGDLHIRLSLSDPASATTFVYFDDLVSLKEGEVVTIPSPGG